MGSYTARCEIVELEDCPSSQNSQRFRQARMEDKDRRPPLLKDDINKLFEAIDLRTSKSLDLSDRFGTDLYRKNSEKKPMRVGGSQSPGIGFSEPVSLKQALRRQSISHASEMAAMKRLSKPPGSPGMLESRKVSSSSIEMSRYTQDPKSMSANHSAHSSPRFLLKSALKNVESTLNRGEIVPPSIQVEIQSSPAQEKSHTLVPSQPCREPKIMSGNYNAKSSLRLHHEAHSSPQVPVKLLESTSEEHEILPSHNTRLSSLKKGTKNPRKNIGISIRVMRKTTPKLRRKGRLQILQLSNATKCSKPIKSTTQAGKPATKTIKKKEIHKLSSAASVSNISNGKSQLVDSTSEMICQRCQCHLKDVKIESVNNDPAAMSKPGFGSNGRDSASTLAVKFNKTSKSTEQEGFSQSSNSSIGEHSSSTTLSDESNLSRSSISIRPHMTKDSKWEAINNVRKQYGFLELGHFSLLKKLGSGDIGTVYLAELIGTNGLFAIKVMDNDFLVRRRKMTRAQTESEILRMLDHPFLPTLYAKFTSDNLLCLVMEFCPGGDLHVLRQKQPGRYFPEQAARFYVAEVLLALEYLHMLGIVYRDLKPENIMVKEDGHIMLTDFDLSLRCSVNPSLVQSPPGAEPPRMSGPCAGSNCIDPFCAAPSCKVSCFLPTATRARKLRAELATQARSLPQLVVEPTEARSNSFVGTHEYLAPEIIKGEVHGSSVDWWTLGIFLYELLYGKTPFKGAGNEETLANVVLHSLKFPDTPIVSCQARDLIRGLLVKEPENRFGTETGAAEIKRHPFFEGLNWALIRCAIPPQVPVFSEIGLPKMAFQEKGKEFLEYSVTGEHLEFELF